MHPQNQEGNYAYSNLANQPSLKDPVLGQAQINKNLIKNLASKNKFLENINSNLESLTFPLKNQLIINKMFENQLAQIAALNPAYVF